MNTIQYPVKTVEVLTLCEILYKLGYHIIISDSFTLEVDEAVKDFQMKNNLVVDGVVGMKTWQTLFEKNTGILASNSKFLSEQDLKDFAEEYDIELATIKAVNEVESSGKGFLIDGKPKILFEGHEFWRELLNRGINPNSLANHSNSNVLYSKWTKIHYEGGVKEYERLRQAIALGSDPKIKEAALSSASWGSFQIMGYHAIPLGYGSVENFVKSMEINEKQHLMAFGKFLKQNNLIRFLKSKNWASFANGYNGSSYKVNKYDEKLEKAYSKYS